MCLGQAGPARTVSLITKEDDAPENTNTRQREAGDQYQEQLLSLKFLNISPATERLPSIMVFCSLLRGEEHRGHQNRMGRVGRRGLIT